MAGDKLCAFIAVLALVAVPTLLVPGWLVAQAHWIGPLSNGLIAVAGLYGLSMVLLATWNELLFPGDAEKTKRANDVRTFASLLPVWLVLALAVGTILRAALTFAPLLAG